jgi:glycerol-3-phosphate acyltransferase PlsY
MATGYYLVRWRTGTDIRDLGSRRTGAFNVGRALSPRWIYLTLAGDMAKGALAVALGRVLGLDPMGLLLVMAAVIVGHNFPVQLGFRGGNGLAAGTGALLVLDPPLALVLAAFFLASLPTLSVLRTRFGVPVKYYTPSKLAVLVLPVIAFALGRDWWQVGGLAALVALILWTIRQNQRYLAQAVAP